MTTLSCVIEVRTREVPAQSPYSRFPYSGTPRSLLLVYLALQCIMLLCTGSRPGRAAGDAVEIGKDLTAASSTPIVLAILADEDSYGYAILQRVREASGGRMARSLSQPQKERMSSVKWYPSSAVFSGSTGTVPS